MSPARTHGLRTVSAGETSPAGAEPPRRSDKYSVADDGTVSDSAKKTFEDIDSFEWIAAKGTTEGYFIIQEDGSNASGTTSGDGGAGFGGGGGLGGGVRAGAGRGIGYSLNFIL